MMLAAILTSCYEETVVIEEEDNLGIVVGEGLDDWTFDTHSGDAMPDYNIVFDDAEVQRFDIVIDPADWTVMEDDLDDIIGSSPGGPPGSFSDETPVYIPCQLFHNGIQWYHVGIRYKGNSSLNSSYNNGIDKLPLRLEFDKFEDEYPEINDQKFYGFEELSLSNNFEDKSLMREKVAADIFRDFGVAAPQTAYYEIYVDYGIGPVYFGLYTVVEIVFDTFLEDQFGSNSGNCYKPEGNGAAWPTSNFSLSDFEKKTNDIEGDWSDIQAIYDVLHSSTRTSNTSQWMADLEALFDVDGFLRYLAVNTTIQNWDTYGRMTHNYYLYNDPVDGLVKWIPWDNNEALQFGKMGGSLSFEFNEVNDNSWPLIGYLIDVAEYKSIYDDYIEELINGIFEPSRMQSIYNSESNIIANSVLNESGNYTFLNGSSEFYTAVSEIASHCSERQTAAENYLD